MTVVRVWEPDPSRAVLKVNELNKLFSGPSDKPRFEFEDAWKAPVKTCGEFRRTVFIGIGGTGQKVLRRFKAKLSRYGLAHLPCFSLLAIDTAPQESVHDPQSEVPLSRNEFVCAQVPNPTQYIAEVQKHWRGEPCAKRELASWLPPEFSTIAVMDGASARRAVGRFAFYVNSSEIMASISSSVAAVRNADNKSKLNSMGLELATGAPTTVYIICSVCGGTGSGMLLDTTYMTQRILALDSSDKIETNGVILTSFPKASDSHRANAYAALAELNYFSLEDTVFSAEYPGDFSIAEQGSESPFNMCYLLGHAAVGGEVINNIESLSEMIAEALFFTTCTEGSGKYQAALSNVANAFDNTTTDKAISEGDRPVRFSSFGIQTCAIADDWIVDRWGSDLCRRVLDGIISGSEELTDRPIVSAADVANRFGAKSASGFMPIQDSLKEMASYADQVLKSDLSSSSDLDDLRFWMRTRRSAISKDLSSAIEDRGISTLREDIDEFEHVIRREAGEMFTSPETGGFVAGNEFIDKMISDIGALKGDIVKTLESSIKPGEGFVSELDRLEEDANKNRRFFFGRPNIGDLSSRFNSALRSMIYNDWRRATYQMALSMLDDLADNLSRMRADMGPSMHKLEEVKARFGTDIAHSKSTPEGLPTYTRSALTEEMVNRMYEERLSDTSRERNLFISSLSSVPELTAMTEDQIYYAMKAYARGRLEETILNTNIASVLHDVVEGSDVEMANYLKELQTRTNVHWSPNPAKLRRSPRSIDILSSFDLEEGFITDSWSTLTTESSECQYALEKEIKDRLWVLRTAHGAHLASLTELDWFWASFESSVDREGTTYLFTHRDYPELMADVMVRPSDKPHYVDAQFAWSKALAYRIVEKSTDPQTVDMYIATLLDSQGHERKISLGKSRLDAFRAFGEAYRNDHSIEDAIKKAEELPAVERIEMCKNQQNAVSTAMRKIPSGRASRVRDLLEKEHRCLEAEINKLIDEAI